MSDRLINLVLTTLKVSVVIICVNKFMLRSCESRIFSFTSKTILDNIFLMKHIWLRGRTLLKATLFLIFMSVTFFSITHRAESADKKESFITSFGNGPVKVRFYADYFCGPCGKLEPKVNQIVKDLVKKNIINITFIDAPFHKFSSLYARYFLFILNEKKDFNHALSARTTLFDAVKESLAERERMDEYLKKKGAQPKPFDKKPVNAETESMTEAKKIEEYLKTRGIKFKPFDVKPVFNVFEGLLREDSIDSTPTCVIEREGKKEMSKGTDDALKALESLKN